MQKSNIFIGIIFISLFLIAGCSSQQSAQAPVPEKMVPKANGDVVSVSISSFKFVPSDVNVKVGDTVVWTNDDSVAHTVESYDGTFKSDELAKGDIFKFVFTKPGKFDYACGIHKSMHGSVTVQ